MFLFPRPPPAEEFLKILHNVKDYNGFIYCAAEILFQRIAVLNEDIIKKYDISGKLTLCVSGAGPLHEYVRIPFEEKTKASMRSL